METQSSSNNLMSSHLSSFGKYTFSLFQLGKLESLCVAVVQVLAARKLKNELAVLVSDLVRLCFCLFRKRQWEKERNRGYQHRGGLL